MAIPGTLRYVQVVRGIQCDAGGAIKVRAGGGAPVTRETEDAIAGYRRDYAGRHGHLANTVVPRVRKIEIARGVNRHATRIEPCVDGRAAIARESPIPLYSGYTRASSPGINPENAVSHGDVNIALGVGGDYPRTEDVEWCNVECRSCLQ